MSSPAIHLNRTSTFMLCFLLAQTQTEAADLSEDQQKMLKLLLEFLFDRMKVIESSAPSQLSDADCNDPQASDGPNTPSHTIATAATQAQSTELNQDLKINLSERPPAPKTEATVTEADFVDFVRYGTLQIILVPVPVLICLIFSAISDLDDAVCSAEDQIHGIDVFTVSGMRPQV